MTTPASPDLISIRRHLHAKPELGLQEKETGDYVAALLRAWGLEVVRGIGKTGLVATLARGGGNRAIGLRAELDALPLMEIADRKHGSKNEGRMHACGHDGHMAMLLGAAHTLAYDPSFSGTVRFIFQPAEENIGGAKLMLEDGLFQRFPCDMIFSMHNLPGMPVGRFATCRGAIAASVDPPTIIVHGKGGHGARPETAVDPIVIGAHIVTALQTVVSRNVDPQNSAVVTVGAFHAGTVCNIVPDKAILKLSLRTTRPEDRDLVISRVTDLATTMARSFGGTAEFDWDLGYPVTMNHPEAVNLAMEAAASATDRENVTMLEKPMMWSEDFSFMLEQVPGAVMLIGNGDSANLHSPDYDFNDAVLPIGVSYWVNLARLVLQS